MAHYFNALKPILEQTVRFADIGITGSVESELYDFVDSESSGSIEIEESN